MKKEYTKIYKRIYDDTKNKDGTEKENELLGEFEIIYGDYPDYAFSLIGIKKDDNKIYNIVGDEVSGMGGRPDGGTKCSIYEIVLRQCHWC